MDIIKRIRKNNQLELVLLVILIVLFLGLGSIAPENFFTVNNLRSMAYQMPEFGILAIGMMVAILTGGINLSVVLTASVSSIVAAYFLSSAFSLKYPYLGIIGAILIAMFVASVAGAFNGFLISYVGITAMLATLGTMTLFEGISVNLTKGGTVSGFPLEFSAIGNKAILGIPIPLLIYMLTIFVSYLLLHKSPWGVKVRMLGSNETATRYTGINTKRVLFSVYVYSALMSSIAGIIMISRYNSAKVDYGSSYMLQTVAAVVLGGTSITGGHGSLFGTVISVAIIQTMSTGLNIIGIDRNIVDISIGGILILVLALRYYLDVRSNKALIQKRMQAQSSSQ